MSISLESLDDIARLEYGRILWRSPDTRRRLTEHWTDPRHPYRERFLAQREIIEFALSSPLPEERLDTELRKRGHTLRTIRREIPPVFGHFYHETKHPKDQPTTNTQTHPSP